MMNEQKELARLALLRKQQELQQLEQGQWPEWQTRLGHGAIFSLDQRRMYADWCLGSILEALLPILPKDLRVIAQTCYNLRQHIWSLEYSQAYHVAIDAASAQKKASSECLPASNSL